MRIAALVTAVLAACTAAADVAVVVRPLERDYSLPEAVMIDELLARLSARHGAAFLITAASALAGEVPEAGASREAMQHLARRAGVDDVVVVSWDDDAVRVQSLNGQQATIAREALSRDPRAAAQLIAASLRDEPVEQGPALVSNEAGSSGQGTGGVKEPVEAEVQPPRPEPRASAQSAGGGSGATTQRPARSGRPGRGEAKPEGPETGAAVVGGKKPPVSPATEGKSPPVGVRAETEETTKQGRLWYELSIKSYLEGNYELALDRLSRALDAGAPRADVLEVRAKVYGALGDRRRQRKVLAELVEIDPSRSDAVISLALLLSEEGLWQDAAAALQNGIAARPDEPQLYRRLADLYMRQRRCLEALEVLRRGLEATGDKELALAMADAQAASGYWQAAMALYGKLAGDDDPTIRARALEALGDCYVRQGMVERAIEAYAEAAQARGQPAILNQRRYTSVYGAVDRMVAGEVARAWQGFEDVAARRQGASREEALAALQAAVDQLGRALALCDDILPPPDLATEHRQRQLYYSLLRESLTAALTYVDTGREDMLDLARQRMAQAQEEKPASPQP